MFLNKCFLLMLQVELAKRFHCLLVAELPRFPFSRDCISVWKRTRVVLGKEDDCDSDGDDDVEDEVEDKESNVGCDSEGDGDDRSDCNCEDPSDDDDVDDDGVCGWMSVPVEEQLCLDLACPAMAHLLNN
jgi:hypothetical protein